MDAIVAKSGYCRLHDESIRRELQIAFDQVDRGEVSDLDLAALLAKAHHLHCKSAADFADARR